MLVGGQEARRKSIPAERHLARIEKHDIVRHQVEQAFAIAPLMVLAWRIVGNEFRSSMARRASEEIAKSCDIDEQEKSVEAFFGEQRQAEQKVASDCGGIT